jgi:hypothetical protein
MKRQFRRWAFRLMAAGLVVAGLVLVILLNPMLTYANKTTYGNYAIFHSTTLDPTLTVKLDQATALLRTSEFYNANLHLDICLNDGSAYPTLVRLLRGQAFAWGFYDKVVLQGNMSLDGNYVELNGYKWNLTQLLTHEMTHCLQFDALGLWRSKPMASIPNWKWEGYAEYVSRQSPDQKDLSRNLAQLLKTDAGRWEVQFLDSTMVPREYYSHWTKVTYCMDIRKMTYQQILEDTTSEQTISRKLTVWFNERE